LSEGYPDLRRLVEPGIQQDLGDLEVTLVDEQRQERLFNLPLDPLLGLSQPRV
jgi:hypothetical protein